MEQDAVAGHVLTCNPKEFGHERIRLSMLTLPITARLVWLLCVAQPGITATGSD